MGKQNQAKQNQERINEKKYSFLSFYTKNKDTKAHVQIESSIIDRRISSLYEMTGQYGN